MSVKNNFSTEEWFKVLTGPAQAGGAVVAASPSGITGLVAEAQAMMQTTREHLSAATRTPLLEAMAADALGEAPPAPTQERPRSLDEARTQALDAVRQALWLVATKTTPADLHAYQNMIMAVAQKTAEAAKEGGLFGIGGVLVDDKEKAVLAELQQLMHSPTDSA